MRELGSLAPSCASRRGHAHLPHLAIPLVPLGGRDPWCSLIYCVNVALISLSALLSLVRPMSYLLVSWLCS